MARTAEISQDTRLKFGFNELTGAVGDSITVFPLVVALALLTAISLQHVLIVFGVFQVIWGVKYGLPISVEPMKALAALAIAGALTYAELALAGLVLGGLLLTIGLTGVLGRVEKWIGEPVIRGVQFAVGLLLFETGLDLALNDLRLAGVGLLIALVVTVAGYKNASALVVLAVGFVLAFVAAGVPTPHWPGTPPIPSLTTAVTQATAEGVFAQLAMTIGNAALATSLLVSDLFDREVTPNELSTSMGLTNLLAIPAGGIPMCHGCDGVAGKYEFGARTGGANVLLGTFYIGSAVFATTALITAFPLALLGVLLAIVALSLAKSIFKSSQLILSVGIGVLTLLTNLGVAFIAGIIIHVVVIHWR